MQAFIMAGGKGTRLNSITNDEIPKCMVTVANKTIIERQIEFLKSNGIIDITIIVGHLKDKIVDFIGDGRQLGVNVKYIKEEKPLGTGGGLFFVKNLVKDDFLLLFGDLILDIDIKRFYEYHKKNNSVLTIIGHPSSHPYDSDLIIRNKEGLFISFDSKSSERNYFYENVSNAGVYLFNPKALSIINEPQKLDLEKFIIPLIKNEFQNVYVYETSEYIKDVGTVDRIIQAGKDLVSGIVEQGNLKNKQKAIFVDRDGTINKFKGFINNANEIELIDGVSEAIKWFNNNGYLVIVVTNQPVIARGECSFEEVDNMHKKIEVLLGLSGSYVNEIIYCPHHPDCGYDGEVKELKIECSCRKPKTGMIDYMVKKYNIDLTKSWLIGDSSVDIQTAYNAKLKSILVKTGLNNNKYQVKPTFSCNNMLESVKFIENYKKENINNDSKDNTLYLV